MRTALIIGTVALTLCATLAYAQTTQPADNDRLNAAIDRIGSAPDPSTAISAYAEGHALGAGSARFHEAFVRRMVQFNVPEMAYRPAVTLLDLDNNNGLGWGVMAYLDAKRGKMVNALSDIVVAAHRLPDDAFVQHTAGQLLAWYDAKAAGTAPDVLRRGIDDVRAQFAGSPGFAAAYTVGKDSLAKADVAGSNVSSPPPLATASGLFPNNTVASSGGYQKPQTMNATNVNGEGPASSGSAPGATVNNYLGNGGYGGGWVFPSIIRGGFHHH